MQMYEDYKGLAWGAVGGAIALAVVGFSYGGWVTAATAEQMAQQRSDTAVAAALAPICAQQFRQHADASANLAALKKIEFWQQAAYIEKVGWATMPGSSSPNLAVARSCAEMLVA
jgi:alpha/beta superfamily hydrolase